MEACCKGEASLKDGLLERRNAGGNEDSLLCEKDPPKCADLGGRAKGEGLEERERKVADRERYRRAMAKARRGGENGQRKLGRESNLLLEKVRRMTGA
ncbi:hypothetical protein BN1723_012328 [Verticillium longisporum]|uniref:Uncharacterized protein n=1 Tax=Verticillium longisporum TaxID=100787 RepID=A0A0G4LH14_VERLO|nr:hypothetical protein BN1723_012328 [Verticillium longisporum]